MDQFSPRPDRGGPPPGSSDRTFGLVFSVVFGLIALAPLVSGREARWWALVPAGACLLAALLRPALLAGPNRVWTRFGLLLHRVMSPVVLAVLFFVVLTPFALVTGLLRKDALRLSRDPDAESYWIERDADGAARQSMRNQF